MSTPCSCNRGRVPCTNCNGGTRQCSSCGGRGRWSENNWQNGMMNTDYFACSSCSGSGKYACSCTQGEMSCPSCHGTGMRPDWEGSAPVQQSAPLVQRAPSAAPVYVADANRTSSGSSKSGIGKLVLFVCVIGGTWFYVSHRNLDAPVQVNNPSHSDSTPISAPVSPVIEKPSPLPQTQPVEVEPSPEIARTPAPPPVPIPAPVIPPLDAAPTATTAVLAPWPTNGTMYSAKHKGRGGCDGELVLRRDRITFICDKDPSKGFSESLDVVKGVDNDGIATWDMKYHFKIAGLDRGQTQQLLQGWINRARAHEHDVSR